MQITHDGVTWEVEGSHEIHQFVNGHPAIVGPIRLLSVRQAGGDGPCSSQISPRPANGQGVSRASRDYDPELDVNNSLPMTLRAGDSLVSCVDRPPGSTPQVLSGAILTIVAKPPDPLAFRPGYAGPQKALDVAAEFGKTAADLVHPAPLVPTDGVAMPPFDDSKIERAWIDFLWEWAGRYLHPLDNMPDYGRDIGVLIGSAALSLCFRSPEDARQTLINLVQIGIDNYSCYKNGGAWRGDGGHGHGRMTPILIAGAALGIPEMLDLNPMMFGEGMQTFFVEETSPGVINNGHGGYTSEQVGLPAWGFCHDKDPSRDDARWSENAGPYRFCCSANSWLGQLTALRLMGLLPAIGHAAWPAYLDRYIRRMKVEGSPGWWRHYNQPWHEQAYDATRLADLPGTNSFGYGRHRLQADVPPSIREGSFRVRIEGGSAFGKVVLAISDKARLIPDQSPPLPAGVDFEGFCYLGDVDALVDKDYNDGATYDIPLPSTLKVGDRFYLQAFVLTTNGKMRNTNALELSLLD